MPRLILRDCSSAFLLSLKEAWKAVWQGQHIGFWERLQGALTGRTKLMTLKLRRQALICVTVLL